MVERRASLRQRRRVALASGTDLGVLWRVAGPAGTRS